MQTTKQNGTTRRSIFAGLMSLPAVAMAARATVTGTPSKTSAAVGQTSNWMPDVIRQSDLQTVFDDLMVIELRILDYRRRILAGAVVEPGKRVCEFESDEPREGEPEPGVWSEFGAFDFNICPVESSYATLKKELAAGHAS